MSDIDRCHGEKSRKSSSEEGRHKSAKGENV